MHPWIRNTFTFTAYNHLYRAIWSCFICVPFLLFLFFIRRVCGFLYSETLSVSILSTSGCHSHNRTPYMEKTWTHNIPPCWAGYIHSGWHSDLKSYFQDGQADCREQHLATLVREPRSMCSVQSTADR